jgi:plastocyanin domain-containing protein
MEIKKNTIIIVVSIFAVVLFGAVSAIVLTSEPTQNSINELNTKIGVQNSNTDEVQNVKLSIENYEYKLEPSVLKKDVPVRMVVDLNTVTGCTRDIVISTFKVRKYVSEGDNIVEFTPTKAGTIGIACSMNMARGEFTVVENDGTPSNYIDSSVKSANAGVKSGSSCSVGGGCGCGMQV